MNIKLIGVGKTDESSLDVLINKYLKRIKRYIKFEFTIISDLKNSKSLTIEKQKEKEGELILKRIHNSDTVVLLDENGKEFTSIQFSKFIADKMLSSTKNLVFIIGGPYGFSEALYQRANQKVSLSKMTFSHQMVRLFFVEQVYRAFTILKNEPYHHE